MSTSTRRSMASLLVDARRPDIIPPIDPARTLDHHGRGGPPDGRQGLAGRAPGRGAPRLRRDPPAGAASRRAERGSERSRPAGWAGIHWPVEHGGRGLTPDHTAAWTTRVRPRRGAAVDQHGRRRARRRLDPRLRHAGAAAPAPAGASSTPTRSGASSSPSPAPAATWPASPAAPSADGDGWVVTGQKVWCSNGRVADRGILPGPHRPGGAAPRRASRSSSSTCTRPGIEVRPLRQMTGGSEFDEVFLDEVRLAGRRAPRPAARRLGRRHGDAHERARLHRLGRDLARPPPRRARRHRRRRRRGRP